MICKDCGRPMDDHQWFNANGDALARPYCMKEGDIKNGVRPVRTK